MKMLPLKVYPFTLNSELHMPRAGLDYMCTGWSGLDTGHYITLKWVLGHLEPLIFHLSQMGN